MVVLCVFEAFLAENLTYYNQVYLLYIMQMTQTRNFVVVGTFCAKETAKQPFNL
jgi:hypothetical protein